MGLINLGTNRWACKPEVGVAWFRGRWEFDGAAGVWQASVEGDPGIDPVYDWTTWEEGMNYPGSAQLGLSKRFLAQYPWCRTPFGRPDVPEV